MVSFKLGMLVVKIIDDLYEESEKFPPDPKDILALAYNKINRIEETEGCDELLLSGEVLSRTVQNYRTSLSARDLAVIALKDILKEAAGIEVEYYAHKYRSRQIDWESVLGAAEALGLTAVNWKPVHDFLFLSGVRDNIYAFAEAVGDYYSYALAEDEYALIPEEVTRLLKRVAETQPISIGLPLNSSFEEWSEFYRKLMYLYYQLNTYVAQYADGSYYKQVEWGNIQQAATKIKNFDLTYTNVKEYAKLLETVLKNIEDYKELS